MICCRFKGHIGLSPLICVLCVVWVWTLHCSVAESLWSTLFDIFGECWVCHRTLDQLLLTNFAGFGKRKEAKSLWLCTIYATIWLIWLELNSRIFNDRISDKQILWDKIRCLAFIWCKAHDLSRGISLLDMLKDWKALLFWCFSFLLACLCKEDCLSTSSLILCILPFFFLIQFFFFFFFIIFFLKKKIAFFKRAGLYI